MRTITCRCDAEIELDLPEAINLDGDPASRAAMAAGTFLNTVCPGCGASLHPELELRVTMPSAGLDALVVPEPERLSVYRGKKTAGGNGEVIIGFAELFERMRLLRDGLDPAANEIVKYVLLGKAEESEPDSDIAVRYHGREDSRLVFHVIGLASGQVGVVRLPAESYERVLKDLPKAMKRAPFDLVFSGPYRSINKLGFLEAASG